MAKPKQKIAVVRKKNQSADAAPTPAAQPVKQIKAAKAAIKPAAVVDEAAVENAREDIRLGFLIHDVSRMRRSAYDQFMKPLGITRAQWWILAHLGRHDGMVQTRLADLLQVGKSSLGDIITLLEAQQWVERRPDPVDKRAKRVYLTKTAQAVLKRMTQMENQFNQQTLGCLSVEQKRALTEALLLIKKSVSQLAPPASDVDEGD